MNYNCVICKYVKTDEVNTYEINLLDLQSRTSNGSFLASSLILSANTVVKTSKNMIYKIGVDAIL